MQTEVKTLPYSIPESLKRTLKKGEYAVYQLVDARYTSEGKFCGYTAGIPNRDVVYDGEGNMVPIGFVEGYTPEGVPSFGSIWFPIESECTVLCVHGIKHASLYNFLEISNYNESNPNRDTNIPAIYRRVDSMNNAKQTRGKRNERVAALKTVIMMSNEEIEKFIKNNPIVGVRWIQRPNGETDWDAIRDGLERWAEHNPSELLSLSDGVKSSSDSEIEKLIEVGKETKFIGFDADTKSWYGVNGKPILKVKSTQDQAHVAELIQWLKSANGLKTYEKLRAIAKD